MLVTNTVLKEMH